MVRCLCCSNLSASPASGFSQGQGKAPLTPAGTIEEPRIEQTGCLLVDSGRSPSAKVVAAFAADEGMASSPSQPSTSRPSILAPMTDANKLFVLNHYSGFVFNLDGTLWRGTNLIAGACEVIELLRYQGKKVLFVTNNATVSRQSILKKLQNLGLRVSLEEIYCGAYAAAAYLKSKRFQKKVYVIGEQGLMDEMHGMGIEAIGGPSHADMKVDFNSENLHISVDKAVGAVVVGMDRAINYFKIQYGLTCLLENEGCLFIATSTDSRSNQDPGSAQDQEWAGAGACVGALIGASEAEPLVVGKPSSFLLNIVCRASSLSKEQLCVVGDRLDTDILWGNQNGCATLLVLSGVTREEQLRSPDNTTFPTYVIGSIGELLTVKDQLGYCVVS